MKLLALLCICVAGGLATNVPLVGSANFGKGVANLAKAGLGQAQAGDRLRDVKQGAAVRADHENVDVKKSAGAQEWSGNGRKSAHDQAARAQDYHQASGNHNAKESAGSRSASGAQAHAADQAVRQRHNDNYFADKNVNWAGKQGYRKGNRKHEGISYAFDKNFRRNANENGGFNAGSSLADHALDDEAARSTQYGRWVEDHGAGAKSADAQSADRRAGYNNAAWAKQASADKFGRDADQASGANGQARDWADKRDQSVNRNNYHEGEARAGYDALNDHALLDRNANRKTIGYGAARDGRKAYAAPGYGYGQAYGYGVAGKGLGLNRAKGAADRSNVWDAAQVAKNQRWAGDNEVDRIKDTALANQWQRNQVQGHDSDERAALHDAGFSRDAAQRNEGGRANNEQGAKARAAHTAGQQRHDLDENQQLKANKKWRQSDRDHKFNEYKKFFNNDRKGGKNFERLKYNRDQTDDSAAADFDVARDDSSAWRDAHRVDQAAKSGRSRDEAWADNAHRNHYAFDGNSNAAAAHQQGAQAAEGSDMGRWGADNDRRKNEVEQRRRDNKASNGLAAKYGKDQRGFDNRGFGKNRGAIAKFGNFGGYGYGGYPSGGYKGYGSFPNYGGNYGGYGNYGYGGYPYGGYYH